MSTATIEIVHGDTRVYEVMIVDEVTGDPIDLDDADLVITAKEHALADEAIFVKTEAYGIDVQDQTTDIGLALLTITDADLVDISNDWATLVFDVRVSRSGIPQTPIRGVLTVIPSIGEGEES